MNKLKVLGLCGAVLIFVFSISARFMDSETAANIILPILAVFCVLLSVVETVSYRKNIEENGTAPVAELVRVITFSVISVILFAAVIIKILQ